MSRKAMKVQWGVIRRDEEDWHCGCKWRFVRQGCDELVLCICFKVHMQLEPKCSGSYVCVVHLQMSLGPQPCIMRVCKC